MVLAILSVCVALVAPALNPERFTDSMKNGIRRFTAALAQARNQAMASGKRHVLLVDYTRQGSGERVCYYLLSVDREGQSGSERGMARPGTDSPTGCFPHGIRVKRIVTHQDAPSEGKASFAVLPNGLIQPGLIFLQEGDRKRTLRIRPYQVYPEILRGHPSREELERGLPARGGTSG